MVTTQPGIEIGAPVVMGQAVTIFRRTLVPASPTIEIAPQVALAQGVANYKRNLATASPTNEIQAPVLLTSAITRIVPVRGLYQPTNLVDLTTRLRLAGDNTVEMVYNIPQKLGNRPHLIAPPNGSPQRLAQPIMRWTSTTEAVYYEVHVALDIDFVRRVGRFDVIGTELQRGFPFGGTYYWRMRAVAGGLVSDFSEVWSFSSLALAPAKDLSHDASGRARLLNQFREDA